MSNHAFVGIDYGSLMIKASVATDPTSPATPLSLEAESPYLPAALLVDRDGTVKSVGVPAYRLRRSSGTHVAWLVRDRLQSPKDAIKLGSNTLGAVAIHDAILSELARIIGNRQSSVKAIGISIPDQWAGSRWALPMAAHEAGWRPILYVRESIAVLSEIGDTREQNIVLMSLGFSGTTLLHYEKRNSVWYRKSSHTEETVSGFTLRKRLTDRFAEDIIRTCRLDPREDSESDQQLWDAVESALIKLRDQDSALVQLMIGSKSYRQTLMRREVLSLTEAWKTSVAHHIERLLSGIRNSSSINTIIWGDLAPFVPMAEWIPHLKVQNAPLDVVAAGTARLCASCITEGLIDSLPSISSLSVDNGAYKKGVKDKGKIPGIPLIEILPTVPKKKPPSLRLIAPSSHEEVVRITQRRFRLGRHPECEWVFDQDIYPQISKQHAEIVYDNGHWVLRDLQSSNGTYRNDERISECQLNSGDMIRLGQDVPCFRFECEQRA